MDQEMNPSTLHDNRESEYSKAAEEFWDFFETTNRTEVPLHLKNILYYTFWDNVSFLPNLKNKDISEIEKLVQSEQFKQRVLSTMELLQSESERENHLKNHYGEFYNSTNQFSFTNLDKRFLKKIAEFAQDLNEKFEKNGVLDECHEMYKNAKKNRKGQYVLAGLRSKSDLLEILIESKQRNDGRKPQGFRYNNSLKVICAYIYLLGGKILYDTLCANLPVPTIQTLLKTINEETEPIIEGQFRINALKKFLEKRKLPMRIWLSEDATKITTRIQHDQKTNQMVGFVLPTSASLPIPKSFLVTSMSDIQKAFKNQKQSNLLYVYMGQAIAKNSPFFCLCAFGTDNIFKAEDCMNRLRFIKKELGKIGIEVVGCSSDGDPRLLKAMRLFTRIGENPKRKTLDNNATVSEKILTLKYFKATYETAETYTQDTVHIVNKLRNRLMKLGVLLPLGYFLASSGHLKIILKNFGKDKHHLTLGDIKVLDKMNFRSTMKLCSPRVRKLLEENVAGSEATQEYLKIMYYVAHSFLSTVFKASERLYCIWYSVFFLRLWRGWLKVKAKVKNSNDKGKKRGKKRSQDSDDSLDDSIDGNLNDSGEEDVYKLIDQFITMNTYMGIEINAHALLRLIGKCIDEGCTDYFLPWQFGSQACEGFFRALRALCSSYVTMTNCTIFEALKRIQKIQFQSDVLVHQFTEDTKTYNINFPRQAFVTPSFDKKSDSIFQKGVGENVEEISDEEVLESSNESEVDADATKNEFDLRNFQDITNILEKAKTDAYETISNVLNMTYFDGKVVRKVDIKFANEICVSPATVDKMTLIEEDEDVDITLLSSGTNDNNEQNIIVVEPTDSENGQDNLSGPGLNLDLPDFSEQMGTDHANPNSIYLRTQDGQVHKKAAIIWAYNDVKVKLSSDRLRRVQQCDDLKSSFVVNKSIGDVQKCDFIAIGDWCLFKKLNLETDGRQFCLIGRVLDFAYENQRTWRQTEYNKSFVDLKNLPKKSAEGAEEGTDVEEQPSNQKNKKSADMNEQAPKQKTKKNLGVIGQWYQVISKTTYGLELVGLDYHGLLDIRQYESHIPEPYSKRLKNKSSEKNKIKYEYRILESTFKNIEHLIEVVPPKKTEDDNKTKKPNKKKSRK